MVLLNRFVNPIVRAILRSLRHRLLSGRLLRLTYTRGNGEARTIRLGYVRRGDAGRISVGAAQHKRWWRAVRHGVRRTGLASGTVGEVVTVAVDLGGRVSSAVP